MNVTAERSTDAGECAGDGIEVFVQRVDRGEVDLAGHDEGAAFGPTHAFAVICSNIGNPAV